MDLRPLSWAQRHIWMIGLSLVILGALGDFEALNFATQSLVTTVGGGSTVLMNVFFSIVWHHEVFSSLDLYGTVCIVLGIVLVSWFAPPDEHYTLDQVGLSAVG